MSTPNVNSRHAHFAADQVSGSHNPPEAFRRPRSNSVPIHLSSISSSSSSSSSSRSHSNNNNADSTSSTVRSNRFVPFTPFDSWVINQTSGYSHAIPLSKTIDLWQARGSAAIALAKGLAFTVIHAVSYIFARIFSSNAVYRIAHNLRLHWEGVRMSARAVISPEEALLDALDRRLQAQ